MEIDLAGRRDGVAERYVPELMRGELIEAEHIARYRWIADVAAGRRVLDAGCGMGYGSVILAEAGADHVLGVDLAESVLDAVRPNMPERVSLSTGDLRSLDLPDDSLDLVVCLEVIEHFADPDVVLDELVRVLAPGGILAVSSPNRLVSVGGNPHHFNEYTPAELEATLGSRLAHTRLVGQRSFVGSVVGRLDGSGQISDERPPDSESNQSLPYALAVASQAELPHLPGAAVLGTEISWNTWTEISAAQQRAHEDQSRRAGLAEQRLADRDTLQARLVEAEQLLAGMPERERELQTAIAERDYAVQWARERVAEVEAASAGNPLSRRVIRALRWRIRSALAR